MKNRITNRTSQVQINIINVPVVGIALPAGDGSVGNAGIIDKTELEIFIKINRIGYRNHHPLEIGMMSRIETIN